MQIRPYQGADEATLLEVWQRAMTHDRISASAFRTQVLLDPNFNADNLPVAVVDDRVVGFLLCITRQVPYFLQGMDAARKPGSPPLVCIPTIAGAASGALSSTYIS